MTSASTGATRSAVWKTADPAGMDSAGRSSFVVNVRRHIPTANRLTGPGMLGHVPLDPARMLELT